MVSIIVLSCSGNSEEQGSQRSWFIYFSEEIVKFAVDITDRQVWLHFHSIALSFAIWYVVAIQSGERIKVKARNAVVYFIEEISASMRFGVNIFAPLISIFSELSFKALLFVLCMIIAIGNILLPWRSL